MRDRSLGHPPSITRVRAAYNQKFDEAPLRDSDRYYRWLAGRVAAELPSPSRGRARVLDAGCGCGALLHALTGSGAFASITGLDVSDRALAMARAEAPGARLILGQGERLPLASQSFDAVVCSGNLEHFVDPCRGARELSRVCHADGAVWVLLPNSYYSGDLWRVITTGYGPNHHQVIDRFATMNEWRDLLEANGLRVESISPYNRFKWWKRLLPRNLAYHFLFRTRPQK